MKAFYYLFSCLLGALMLVGCSLSIIDDNKDPNNNNDINNNQGQQGDSYEYSPAVKIELSHSDMSVRSASNAFGITIFNSLVEEDLDNSDVVFSPLSLSLALSMAAEGANGSTLDQFKSVMGLSGMSKEEIGEFYKTMVEGMRVADKGIRFISSNSLWFANNLTIKDSFKHSLSLYYSAETFSADFSSPKTVQTINDWCSTKTDGKITKILESLDPNSRMILINALLFKAPWEMQFSVQENCDFTGLDKNTKKDFITATNDYLLSYGRFQGYQIAGVPYGNGAYEMDVVLPDEGKSIRDVLSIFNESNLTEIKTTPMEISLPKFETEYSTEDVLMRCLSSVGLTNAFSQSLADFSGISNEKLFIGNVIQKTSINVTEKGTEFSAATMLGLIGSASPNDEKPKRVSFEATRPFIYIIRETSTNAILLIGTLSR
jgi:serpin B